MKELVKEINEITERYDRMYTATIYGSVEGARHQQECDFERLVYLVKKMNYIPCCDKLPNIESTDFRDWMTDNGYTGEQYGTMQKGDKRYCINNLFKHYQNLLEFGN